MKMKTLLLVSIGILFAGCGTHMGQHPQAKWKDKANWDSLEKGMTKAQVRARIGRPPLEGDFDITDTENWYYPDPDGGIVRFDRKDHVIGFRTPWDPGRPQLVKVE